MKELSTEEKWRNILRSSTGYIDPERLTKIEYGLLMAQSASTRSEDPHTKVGCSIINEEGRIVSTGYNGLINSKVLPIEFTSEEYRDIKRVVFIHAEINALSRIKRGEGITMFLTHSPCLTCACSIAAHNIKNIIYIKKYMDGFEHIFDFYNISYRKASPFELEKISNL